jgi:hypothetical protein
MVDDTDDAGVDRRFSGIEREAGLFAADEEHFFADARADRVDRDEGPPCELSLRRERLDEQQLDPDQVLVLPRGDDIADDPP